ncbi:MAG: thermonuclease family protein [bacterium]|nr:thermonuclease family protein [bacterium]MDE0418596.1 thermonuclease family protein [bacterium]
MSARSWSRRACAALLILVLAPAGAQALTGEATVVDGDTILIGAERIRIFGIDAPESNQDCGDGWPCGREATSAVEDMTRGKSVRCEGDTRDFYGRLIAVCYAGSVDIGGDLVRRGLALAYRKYSMAYVEHEDEARQHGRGMWSGAFVAPWDWRRGVTLPAEEPETADVSSEGDMLALYDDNGNGSISCSEARHHGIAPVKAEHPAYQFMRDGDGDGVVCE